MVDDSIVRGTPQTNCNMVREAGAKEVHVRIASPPVTHLFLRYKHPDRKELLGAIKP